MHGSSKEPKKGENTGQGGEPFGDQVEPLLLRV